MHRDGPSCTEYHRVVFISSILTSELHRVPPSCFLLLYLVFICTMINRNAPRCTKMHQSPSSWLFFFSTSELHWVAPSCFLLLYILLICTVMHRVPPSCTELYLHHDTLRCHCALQWLANVKFIPASWILKTSSDLMKTKWKKVLKRKLNG